MKIDYLLKLSIEIIFSTMAGKTTTFSTGYTEFNTVRLIRGGKDYFSALIEMIENAKSLIHFQFYIFDDDETGNIVKDALIKAAKSGIAVHMVLDGYASKNLPGEFIDDLRAAGINFRWFEPFFKARYSYFGRRLHHKVVVADGIYSLVGGSNIGNRYNDMPDAPAWLDWAIWAKGEVSSQLCAVCVDIWRQARWRFRKEKPLSIPNINRHDTEKCRVRVRRNDWVRNKKEVTSSYLEMFKKASERITIMSSYFLPGNLLQWSLFRAAKRGVKIQVILAGTSDIFLSKQAERYIYRKLLRRGIEIYEYDKSVLHGKLATYDGVWTTVGSYNFNYISAYASIELNLDIDDKRIAGDADHSLGEIMKNESDRINEEVYRTRYNVFQRFLQWSCYNLIRGIFFVFTFYFKPRR